MRTTVTLDDDTAALLQRRMREQGISFKEALNQAIRAGLNSGGEPRAFRTRTHAMGVPTVNLDQALRLAGDIEDEELVRKSRLGK